MVKKLSEINKIYCGDCLQEMTKLESKSVDMILTDLPYGTTSCDWDCIIPFEKLWANYNRIIKDNCCTALFGSEPFSSYLSMSNIKKYKYDWCCAGSGTTAIACLNTNRNYICIEKELKYFEIMKERIEKYCRMIPKKDFGGYFK